MAYYRCYYLDSDNHVRSTDVIACENDAQAEARANLILHSCGYPGIEVWDRERMVCRVRDTGRM